MAGRLAIFLAAIEVCDTVIREADLRRQVVIVEDAFASDGKGEALSLIHGRRIVVAATGHFPGRALSLPIVDVGPLPADRFDGIHVLVHLVDGLVDVGQDGFR